MPRMMIILLLLLALLLPAYAQESDVTFAYNLDATFTVTDLNLQFAYPDDWIYGTNNGIFFAQTDEDLSAVTDDDETTLPENNFFSVTALPFDLLGLTPDNTLDEIADTFIQLAQITEIERFNLGVMSRQSISVIGQNTIGRYGILTIFTRNDLLIIFSMGAPELELLEEAYAFWGGLLYTINPVDTLPLTTDAIILDEIDYTINYPEAWFFYPEQYAVLQLESDTTIFANPQTPLEGHLLLLSRLSLDELGLDSTATLEEISQITQQLFGDAEIIITDDYDVAFAPAIGLEITRQNGAITYLAGFVVGDNLNLVLLGSPDLDAASAIYDTWLTILKSIQLPG